MSRWLHDNVRAGRLPPPTILDGVTTVDVSAQTVGFNGHSFYCQSEQVLDEIRRTLAGVKPDSRGLRPLAFEGRGYWEL